MKKIIITGSIISFLNFIGCALYEVTESLPPYEYIKYEQTEGKPKEIYVLTENESEYHFGYLGYNIVNDTLRGRGTQVVDGSEIPFNGSIPVEEIRIIEWNHRNELAAGISLGLLFALGLVLGIGSSQ